LANPSEDNLFRLLKRRSKFLLKSGCGEKLKTTSPSEIFDDEFPNSMTGFFIKIF
jgi:hypothetical protein